MSELTDDQKRSIEKNDQKDLSQDDHAGTEPQGETFRERIAEKIDGLKKSVSDRAAQAVVLTGLTIFNYAGGQIETAVHNHELGSRAPISQLDKRGEQPEVPVIKNPNSDESHGPPAESPPDLPRGAGRLGKILEDKEKPGKETEKELGWEKEKSQVEIGRPGEERK